MARVRNFRPIYRNVRPPEFKFILSEKGRWGPAWLHRIVWRMVINLGMFRANMDPVVSYRPFLTESATRQIQEMALDYLDEDFHRTDLVAYAGTEAFYELLRERDASGIFYMEEDFGSSQHGFRVVNIPVITLPEIEGVIVVPKAKEFGQ